MRKEQVYRQVDSIPLPQEVITRHAFEEFTYLVAHDLGAPLRRMVSFTQLLEKKCRPMLDMQALHYIDLINENGQRAQARLASLLQYSRLDTIVVAQEQVDCKQVIERCLHQLRADIESHEALIHVGPMPQITGDSERLELLFYCLISNSLKFCKERPDIDICARYEYGSWIFSVHDCGIGIDLKDQEEIFNIFCRLHVEEEYPGVGMGLALAKRIAELHGGSIEVESHPGEGTTFYVFLPHDAHGD